MRLLPAVILSVLLWALLIAAVRAQDIYALPENHTGTVVRYEVGDKQTTGGLVSGNWLNFRRNFTYRLHYNFAGDNAPSHQGGLNVTVRNIQGVLSGSAFDITNGEYADVSLASGLTILSGNPYRDGSGSTRTVGSFSVGGTTTVLQGSIMKFQVVLDNGSTDLDSVWVEHQFAGTVDPAAASGTTNWTSLNQSQIIHLYMDGDPGDGNRPGGSPPSAGQITVNYEVNTENYTGQAEDLYISQCADGVPSIVMATISMHDQTTPQQATGSFLIDENSEITIIAANSGVPLSNLNSNIYPDFDGCDDVGSTDPFSYVRGVKAGFAVTEQYQVRLNVASQLSQATQITLKSGPTSPLPNTTLTNLLLPQSNGVAHTTVDFVINAGDGTWGWLFEFDQPNVNAEFVKLPDALRLDAVNLVDVYVTDGTGTITNNITNTKTDAAGESIDNSTYEITDGNGDKFFFSTNGNGFSSGSNVVNPVTSTGGTTSLDDLINGGLSDAVNGGSGSLNSLPIDPREEAAHGALGGLASGLTGDINGSGSIMQGKVSGLGSALAPAPSPGTAPNIWTIQLPTVFTVDMPDVNIDLGRAEWQVLRTLLLIIFSISLLVATYKMLKV